MYTISAAIIFYQRNEQTPLFTTFMLPVKLQVSACAFSLGQRFSIVSTYGCDEESGKNVVADCDTTCLPGLESAGGVILAT